MPRRTDRRRGTAHPASTPATDPGYRALVVDAANEQTRTYPIPGDELAAAIAAAPFLPRR